MSDSNEDPSIDDSETTEETLERLRNITKLFSGETNHDENQQLKKVEKFAPSAKIKNTFQKFEDIGLSNGQSQREDDDYEESTSSDTLRSPRRKSTPKEHIPYHEMAEVKDKFEKGLIDSNKPRIEKRLDVRVQSGLTSSKKQAFEQGEFEQEIESRIGKTQIEADLVAGLASTKKQVFEQQSLDYENQSINKTTIIEHDILVGLTAENKAKFESGQMAENSRVQALLDEVASFVGTGLAQAKLSEFLSKIDAEQQNQRSTNRCIDIDTEQGLAIARREQLATLANSGYKPTEKYIDVTAGLASTIKEQYIADASKSITSIPRTMTPPDDIESGLAKNRAIVFEKPDETAIKRTVNVESSELVERGVAKERVAMFKNLENGLSSSSLFIPGETKIRVDENGSVVRESDKTDEIYFEKGQTKQLVEQWKIKQISPERDSLDAQMKSDADIVQQGKAKNLVQMWRSIDKENTPPSERRGPRPITPPVDNVRRILPVDDSDLNSHKSNYVNDTINIESGYAKAVRERFLQNAEQNNNIEKRKTLKQITPPPESFDVNRRKSLTPPNDNMNRTEYANNEEIVSNKGQAKSLKNRFIELEQDARKIETASSKLKYTPKRFVSSPAPKQFNAETSADLTKCFGCNKTVYAMEKIEANKKVYHRSCFKCMHCKTILKIGNYTSNDGQIYCKPHFLQLFAIKGNYSTGFGLDDHKIRWLPSNSPNGISTSKESTSFCES